jgi:aldehyde dehydrogenase (NAD+)
MYDCTKNYIDGEWVASSGGSLREIINPASERSIGRVCFGIAQDVDRAVAAARSAFESFSQWPVERRSELLERIIDAYLPRSHDMAAAISAEMGAPAGFALKAQAASGVEQFRAALEALQTMEFEETIGTTRVVREPIGVCGLITPWNWPVNQIACKVAPALAAGCTMVLKPSEIAPVNATIFAEILAAAGVPRGVFNLVHGDGPGVGSALAAHPGIDMVSFTGSTRAGVLVAKAAADTVKRVAQELGGKSPNIILEGAPLEKAVVSGVRTMFSNSGQSCNAPSRMLVPAGRYEEAVAIAAATADKTVVGDPQDAATHIGPVASENQYNKIQTLILKGLEEGARLAAGGPGKPAGLQRGYYVRPTVFRDVRNDMTIAREEIFGPVLCMIPYTTVEEAIRIANDTAYGLSGYVYGATAEEAMAVARSLRTGMVHLNGAPTDVHAPFGGYKQSGFGREQARQGIEAYTELKTVVIQL